MSSTMHYFNHATQTMCSLNQFNASFLQDAERHQHAIIAVEAIGVNRADILQAKNRYPLPQNSNPILGLEVAGYIEALPSTYHGELMLGQRVACLVEGGGYATHVSVPTVYILPLSAGMNVIDAAALPEALMTLWLNLGAAMLAQIQQPSLLDKTVLVRAASSGVGSLAIMVLASMGFNVLGTCSTLEKSQRLNAYLSEYAAKQSPQLPRTSKISIISSQMLTQQLTQENLVHPTIDYALDMLGGLSLAQAIECANQNAHIACIAFLENRLFTINLAAMLQKNLTLTGRMLRWQPETVKAELVQHIKQHLWHLFEQKQIQPIIHQVFEFSAAGIQAAHQTLLSNQHLGKCVLVM